MLNPHLVEDIQGLVAAGCWSMRRIARELGVARGTVLAIAHGRRRDRRADAEAGDPVAPPSGPIQRCPGCGGLVYMPCVLCSVREWSAKAARPKTMLRPEGLLGVGLVGEHHVRYEEVRAQKVREMALGGKDR